MQAVFAQDSSRVVRLERWQSRAFHVVACPFRVDLPLDMSGCIVSALKETMAAGHRRSPGGLILASDRRAGTTGGAIFVEVEPMSDDDAIAWIEGDLLVRALPGPSTPLRTEVDELVRWSSELGRDVDSFYVGFTPGEGPRSFRPGRLFAALEDVVVETFEIRSSRRSVIRALP